MYWKSNVLQDALVKLCSICPCEQKNAGPSILYYNFTTATKQKKLIVQSMNQVHNAVKMSSVIKQLMYVLKLFWSYHWQYSLFSEST